MRGAKSRATAVTDHASLHIRANPHAKNDWTLCKLGPHNRPSRGFCTGQIRANTAQSFSVIAKATAGKCVHDQHYKRKNTKFGLRLICVKTRRFLKNTWFSLNFRFHDQHSTICNFRLRFRTTPTCNSVILQVSEQNLP